ncbi:MAG: GMC family oxidoreductase [Candidatus Binatia bacterium]
MSSVCVIGGGAAGSVLALRLARRGISVTMLESGPRLSARDKEARFLEVMNGKTGVNPYRLSEERLEMFRNNGQMSLPLDFERVRALGGTTLLWLGNCPRMLKADFKMRSAFGLAEDWPIGYEELEPYYGQAEAEIGVAGAADNPFAEYRSGAYPMPPIPFSYADKFVKRTTDRLGIEFHHTPQARNSVPYGNRSQCLACAYCEVCPSGAKATFDVTHAAPAEQTGRVRITTGATTLRIEVDERGRAKRAIYAGLDRVEHAHEADVFVVACGGIETPRLLLLSTNKQFPAGLANRSGLVGKHLMNHPIVQVTGRIEENVYPYRVGFESSESFQFYATHARDELGAFLMNINNFGGGTPAEIAARSNLWGDELAREVQKEFGHYLSVSAGVDQLPDERNTVGLDPLWTDYFGLPIPLVTYRFDDYTHRALQRAAKVQSDILEACGATEVFPPRQWWPGHHMGTTRMGRNPTTSVVDANLRTHDVPNLYLLTTGCFVTGGAANPTLTLSALALRLGDHLANAG